MATVIDLATPMVVRWQLAGHMRTSLVVDACIWPSTPATRNLTRSSTATAAVNVSREFARFCAE